MLVESWIEEAIIKDEAERERRGGGSKMDMYFKVYKMHLYF